MSLWTPIAFPDSHSYDGAEGGLVFDAADSTEVVYKGPSDEREGKGITGYNYLDSEGDLIIDPDVLEGGRFDEMRRGLYQAFKRLRTLLYLLGGNIIAWQVGFPWEAVFDGNFTDVFQFDASGSGDTIFITWADMGDTDPRTIGVYPGMGVIVDRNGLLGQSQLMNFEFLSTTSARLTLSRNLDANVNSLAWLIRENALEEFPIPHLSGPLLASRVERCRHAIESPFQNYFSTAKVKWPAADWTPGVAGDWHCANLVEPTVDLSEFTSAGCANINCPLFSVFTPYFTQADDISNFFLQRGTYFSQESPASMDLMVGRDGFSGLFQLIGIPINYFTAGLFLAQREYQMYNQFAFRTGDKTDDKYDEFLDWLQLQAKLVADGGDETDAAGIILAMANGALAKKDPTGGASPANRALINSATRTPGYTFERAMNVRRIGTIGKSVGSTPGGPGEGMIQRSRVKRHTTVKFQLPALITAGSITDDETTIEYLSPAVTIGAHTYDLCISLPRATEEVENPTTRQSKTDLSNPVVTVAVASGIRATIDFQTGDDQAAYPIDGTTVGTSDFNSGGNVVRGDIAWENWNPYSLRTLGDRQSGLYPGDSVTFDHVDVAGISITCIAAEAFGGSTDGGAVAPNGAAPYMSDKVTNDYNKRDQAVFSLEGYNGQRIKAWINSGSAVGVTMNLVSHGAISPPMINAAGASNGYEPTIKKVANNTTVSAVTGTDFVYDPDPGKLYIKSSVIDSVAVWNFFFEGWVFDAQLNYPCEIAEGMNQALDDVCDNGWVQIPLGGSGPLRMQLYSPTLDQVAPGDHIKLFPPGVFAYDEDPELTGMVDYNLPTNLVLQLNFFANIGGVTDWEARWTIPAVAPSTYKTGIEKGFFPEE